MMDYALRYQLTFIDTLCSDVMTLTQKNVGNDQDYSVVVYALDQVVMGIK